MSKPMTPEQEHEFFARPENQGPQGPPRRREASRLSAMGAGSVSTRAARRGPPPRRRRRPFAVVLDPPRGGTRTP